MNQEFSASDFRLGLLEVHTLEGRVIGPAGEQHLRPKSADVLLCLARNAGAVVERDRLLAEVWGPNAVSDESMTSCIGELRRIFSELGEDSNLIETIPKRGYRLTVIPQDLEDPDSDDSVPDSPSIPVVGASRHKWLWPAVAAVVLAAAFVLTMQGPNELEPLQESPAIAVLPLRALSDDTGTRHFADGLVEDLLDRLSAIKDLKVISRTSSEVFRNQEVMTMAGIAEQLGVQYVVEGSVQRHEGKARIHVKLVDAREDRQLWSRQFDRELADIFTVQSEIALDIATNLAPLLSDPEQRQLRLHRTESVAAFDAYHMGRYHWNRRTAEGYQESIAYFEQAIDLDPAYGLAYAGLADTYHLMAMQRHIDRATGRDLAIQLAQQALELDPTLAEAHTVLASIYSNIDHDWKQAEPRYQSALALNPNYSTVHHYYSEYLSIIGEHEKARKHINTALELNPLSFVIRHVSMKLYFHRGQFEEALAEARRCRELLAGQEHNWLSWYEFRVHLALGNESEALAAFKRVFAGFVHRIDPEEIDRIYAGAGFDGLLERLVEVSPGFEARAVYSALLGQPEAALSFLAEAVHREHVSPEFAFALEFQPLHSKPQFMALLNEFGLPLDPSSLQEERSEGGR